MNAAHALTVLFLAVVSAQVVLYLWKRRGERVRRDRVGRALVQAIRRDLGFEGLPKPGRLWLRGAS